MIKINIVLDATKLRLKNETAKKFLGFFIGKSRFSVVFRLHLACVGCRISKTNGAPSFFDLCQENATFCNKNITFLGHIPQKRIYLHRVFHSIRFKVNKDWTTAVVLFSCPFLYPQSFYALPIYWFSAKFCTMFLTKNLFI